MNKLGILLIESSSKKIEFGFVDKISEEFIINEELDPNDNADTLTYFIKKAFNEKKIDFKEIEYVSLSNGPGSFTGLRIGSAITKGICFSLQCKLIEVPTLDIIAGKYYTEFSDSKNHSEKEVISLIFSNTKTLEFYYCGYKFEYGYLNRISDFKIDVIENIIKEDCAFVINENISDSMKAEHKQKLINVSNRSNLESQYKLTKDYIRKNKFSDYEISEPFYMKEFVPK